MHTSSLNQISCGKIWEAFYKINIYINRYSCLYLYTFRTHCLLLSNKFFIHYIPNLYLKWTFYLFSPLYDIICGYKLKSPVQYFGAIHQYRLTKSYKTMNWLTCKNWAASDLSGLLLPNTHTSGTNPSREWTGLNVLCLLLCYKGQAECICT